MFLQPEWLKSFEFPYYTFLRESEILSELTFFLGKNLFQQKFGIRNFKLSNFFGSA